MGKLLALGLAGIIGALIGDSLRDRLGLLRELKPKRLPNCHLIQGIEAGSEDIEILPNGLAFISSGLKSPVLKSFAPNKSGEILLMDLKEENPHPVELRISGEFDVASFNPHGISIYTDKDEAVYFFVVNHPQYKSTVEIFKFLQDENALLHLKTIQHKLLTSVNDIIALGPESFYATIDRYFTESIFMYFEIFLGLAWTKVIYYSPEEVKEVAGGFYSANGINISPDGKYIYVADFLGNSVHVFEKHSNMSLIRLKVVQLGTLVDNISVELKSGDLWVGCHPNFMKLFFYNPEDLPGSEVLRIQNIHSDKPTVTQVYVDDGSIIQGSSVATLYGKNLLIGTVFHRALHCQL